MNNTAKQILIALYRKYDGNFDKMYADIIAKNTPDNIEDVDCNGFVTVIDKEYNEILRNYAYKPPLVIKYEGDLSALSKNDYLFVFGKDKNNVLTDTPKDKIITYSNGTNSIDVGGKLQLKVGTQAAWDVLNIGVLLSNAIILVDDFFKNSIISIATSIALAMGKDIATVPSGNPLTVNNDLLFDGAILVRNADDIKLFYSTK